MLLDGTPVPELANTPPADIVALMMQIQLTRSNYWSEVHPMLAEQAPKQAFVIAGDVAGNEDAIPAFKDVVDNVTLLASGMGEVVGENAMLVTVSAGGPEFRLLALDQSAPRGLDDYSVERLNELPWDAFRREPSRHWVWRYTPVFFVIISILGLMLILVLRRKFSSPFT